MNFRVHCLSLPRCRDRRAKFQQEADRIGLSFSYVDGPDAQQMPVDQLIKLADQSLAQSRIGRSLTLGEIACAEGHRQIYRRLSAKMEDAAVILEDDVTLDNQFCDMLQGIRKLERELTGRRVLILLGGPWIHRLPLLLSRRQPLQVSRAHRLHRVLRSHNALHGTYGYMISHSAAVGLLEAEPRISVAADAWDHFWAAGVFQDIWVLEPQVVFHSADFSGSMLVTERLKLEQEKARLARRPSARLRRLARILISPGRMISSLGTRLGWLRIKTALYSLLSHFC